MDGAFVEFRHVHASYSVGRALPHFPVFRDISFSLESGAHVVVFGNGASGKSTLLKLLRGTLVPDSGSVIINGKKAEGTSVSEAGYVSLEQEALKNETVYEALHSYGISQSIEHLPARIGEILQVLGMQLNEQRNISHLSTSEKIKVHLARAALSEAPILLFDDILDVLGVEEMKTLLTTIFRGRTVCVTTRSATMAESLDIPILLLHKFTLVCMGTKNEIAHATGTSRVIDAWVEGMRYDLLRKLRSHPGVLEVRLIPTNQFNGTCLRITIRNSRYLPALYDALSQVPLVTIEELPIPLEDILESLP